MTKKLSPEEKVVIKCLRNLSYKKFREMKGKFVLDAGICLNLKNQIDDIYLNDLEGLKPVLNIINSLPKSYSTWKHFTGNFTLPILGDYIELSFRARLWKGEQLEYRLSLIKHMIYWIKNNPIN